MTNHEELLRPVRILAAVYFGIGALTLAALALLPKDITMANDAVWTRAGFVVVSSVLTYLFAARAAKGSRRAYLRLRIASAIMLVAILVIVVLPGPFPIWMKIDQVACGLVLVGVAVAINGRRARSLFAAQASR